MTHVNSKEYRNIISCLNTIKKEGGLQGTSAKEKVDYKAQRVIALGTLIEKYIQHKSADGVKPNVMRKLAAVEKLQKFVAAEYQKLDFSNASFKNTPLKKEDFHFDASYNDYHDRIVLQDSDMRGRIPPKITDASINEINSRVAASEREVTAEQLEMLHDMDECMRRITCKAAVDGMGAKAKSLDDLRRKFIGEKDQPKKNAPAAEKHH